MPGGNDREIVRPQLEVPAAHRDNLQPEFRAEPVQCPRDRRVALDQDPGRAQDRLEEDLDRAAGQARVLHGHGAVLAGNLLIGRSGALLAEGQDPQQHRLAALDGLQA